MRDTRIVEGRLGRDEVYASWKDWAVSKPAQKRNGRLLSLGRYRYLKACQLPSGQLLYSAAEVRNVM